MRKMSSNKNCREAAELTEALQEQIVSHVNAIRECEKKIDELRMQFIDQSDPEVSQSAWINLRHGEIDLSPSLKNRGNFDGDPCYAVASLLAERLKPEPQSHLLLRGCTILTQDKYAQFCITGDVDEKICAQIRV